MNNCPGCLKTGHASYCPACQKRLFKGKKVSHILNFSRPEFEEERLRNVKHLSISGIQLKYSLKLENSSLLLTESGGQYILKPVPRASFREINSVPANEHLTMQIAAQIFKINTATNALIFFPDGTSAYLVKRFDIADDGEKLLQEDFAQLMQYSEETGGVNYKYDSSYEEMTEFMKKYIATYKIEIEKFFRLVLFNYLFSNGDAHLKNFSLYRNKKYGDYLLTPAYDLLNTSLHVPGEADTALELFKGGYMTEAYKHGSKYTYDDLFEFGIKAGILTTRVIRLIAGFTSKSDMVAGMISRSYLSDNVKALYLTSYQERLKRFFPAG